MRKLSGAAGPGRAAAAIALVLPGGISAAQTIAPKPNLTTLVAQAQQLQFQINALSEQYDGLRLQLGRAQANERIAEQAASRVSAALDAQPAGHRSAGRRQLHGLRPGLRRSRRLPPETRSSS